MISLLNKGLEVELYACDKSFTVVPISSKLKTIFPEFAQEPDERNFEYITIPTTDYDELKKEIILPRIKARSRLKEWGLLILPMSCIPTMFDKKFYFSNSNDQYHKFIADTYGSSVITTSLHINFGIDDTEKLFKILSTLRLYCPLFLALSCSSPFHDGKITSYNSFRWHSFPKTPSFVPFFKDHNDYINWINKNIESHEMYNVRHLWTSIRPNGIDRPYKLNRIEIRICDLVSDVEKLISIIAFIECIIQKHLRSENYPKIINSPEKDLVELVNRLNVDEENVAQYGLNAEIYDFSRNGIFPIKNIIESECKGVEDIAKELGLEKKLSPVFDILTNGNDAHKYVSYYNKNKSIIETVEYFTQTFEELDFRAFNFIKNIFNEAIN